MKSLRILAKELTSSEVLTEGRGDAEFYIKVDDEYKLVKWPIVSGWEQIGWKSGSKFGDFNEVEYQNFISGEIVAFDCSDLTEAKGRGVWNANGLGTKVKGKFKSFFDVEKLLTDGTMVNVIKRKWKKAKAMAPMPPKDWTMYVSDYDSEVLYSNPELEQYFDQVSFSDWYDGSGYYTILSRSGSTYVEKAYKTKDIVKILKQIEQDVTDGKMKYRNV